MKRGEAFELGDLVEDVCAVEDELRTLTNLANRSFDALREALAPPERFGVPEAELAGLRERLAHGSSEISSFREIGDRVEERVSRDARAEADKLARVVREDTAPARLQRFEERLREALERARETFEHLGRLELLQERRGEAEGRRQDLRARLADDAAGLQLIDLALAARAAAAERAALDARAFVEEAEEAARSDGELEGLAANARALRGALGGGGSPAEPAEDLVSRVVHLALALGREREEGLRGLARLEETVERRQELSRELFETVTLASEILEETARLEERFAAGRANPAALRQLQSSCLQQGLSELLLSLREERVESDRLDRAISELSSVLGALVTRLSGRSEVVRALAPLWEELAALDRPAIETEALARASLVLGVDRDEDGRPVADARHLAEMAAADSLEPWRVRLLSAVTFDEQAPTASSPRLEAARHALDGLADAADDEDDVAGRAREARGALTHVLEEAHAARSAYADRLRARIQSDTGGFVRVEKRAQAFAPARDAAAEEDPDKRREGCLEALRRVRRLFSEVESETLGASSEAAVGMRRDEETTRDQMIGLQRALGVVLARLRRLERTLFPAPGEAASTALALAVRIRRGDDVASDADEDVRERLGEALEALWLEKQFLEHLALPGESEQPVLGDLSRRRNSRLVELSESSLVLLFDLLRRLADEFDGLDESERPGHISWIEELLAHATTELDAHADRLERCLLALPDNDARAERFATVFDAYHAWAQAISESDAGMELVASSGASLFETLEAPFGRLGERTLVVLEAAPADWRTTSTLESLLALLERLAEQLDRTPTASDVSGALRRRARRGSELRDRIVADAEEAEPDRGPIFESG